MYRVNLYVAAVSTRARFLKQLPIYLMIIVFAMVPFYIENRTLSGLGMITAVTLGGGILSVVLGGWFALTYLRKRLSSYQLVIENRTMTRTQKGLSTIAIPFEDVLRVDRTHSGALIVIDQHGKAMIMIPDSIENRSELEAQLGEHVSITDKETTLGKKILLRARYLIGILTMTFFMFLHRADVVLLLGIVLAIYLLSSVGSVFGNRNLSRAYKGIFAGAYVLIFGLMIIPRVMEAGRILFG